jgi:hypothetical protein
LSWKSVDSPPTEEGYFWLWDAMFSMADLVFMSPHEWASIDPDYTHWMYDGESPEEPEGP